ncbi:uncharacterized protein F4812DRAFT_283856 [Daldinia caldariorum]|uniref:uncharacterized protein n=1 Tax=Daldinia caldariorum TaxID=326644 RepID=UPI002008277C|nr:uncharacterized protein F4812DRAFT_283856 [Daldinia caldariorum]KAI1470951.1 hypothetical protein F4812DRAFT_283856 [Daldinia caldariorum]
MHYHAHPDFHPAYSFPQGNTMQYNESPYHNTGFPGFQYIYGYQPPRSHLIADRGVLADPKAESKPRLSKEEVEKLEKVFRENSKPSSSVKAQLADSLGLERPRINNWFQNRRAKAKQEKKQQEYEEQRAKEKASSEPDSPDASPQGSSSDQMGENARQRVQPSSAIFPDINSIPQETEDSDDDDTEDDSPDTNIDSPSGQDPSGSLQGNTPSNFQSPLPFDFSHSDVTEFTQTQSHQSYHHSSPMTDFTPCSVDYSGQSEQMTSMINSLPSPNEQGTGAEQSSQQYHTMVEADLSTPTVTPFAQSQSTFTTPGLVGNAMESLQDYDENTPMSERLATPMMPQGMPTPTDSFKSPPPPANIASRRNIPRPATLQTSSLRSRSYNLGYAPKMPLDPSSPGSAIRRIASGTSNHGRIQKPSSGSRSPMFLNRNAEALIMQFQNRSPVIPVSSMFPGAAPPTPMTPAVVDKQDLREVRRPEYQYALGNNLGVSESNLKTPPDTPGLLAQFGSQNYHNNVFHHGMNYPADQPIFTPFETEFPDLSMQNVPCYAELHDGLPTTPLYQNMMGSIQEQNTYAQHATGNTQFDWDSNESVNSKPSPNQSRSRLIQFTQNMTPQDYTSHHEK